MPYDDPDERALRATSLTRKAPLERPLEHADLVSTHKRRADWFLERAAWPAREVSQDLLERAQKQAASMAAPAGVATAWTFAGPSNIGGRVTAVLAHSDDADRILIGSAGGGVWRSADLGETWERVWDDQAPSLNIGSLAADPSQPETVYCGTGEANNSADSHPGVGLYRSNDFGSSWDLIAPSLQAGLPMRIGTVAVDPSDLDHILVGGISYGLGSDGLWQSQDGGTNWVRVVDISVGRYRCQQVAFGPAGSGTLFATVWERGFRSGVWRSQDGGASWHQLTQGLPPGFLIGRSALAIAPSNPDRIYLQMSTTRSGSVLGLYRSDDGGDHWMEVTGGHFQSERQMNYNNTIAVHPNDPDLVVCGGVDIHRSRDGGGTWRAITRWNRERGDPQYAHADQHVLVMPATRPDLILAGNDGGLDVSLDSGDHWTNRSDGLEVTMFYDVAVAATDRDFYGGGCQDNGTNLTVNGRPDDFFELTGGDGGWMVIDPDNPARLFTSSQSISIYRHTPGTGWEIISPPDPNRDGIWMAIIVMSPVDRDTLFVGSFYVWRTTDGGDHWQLVTPVLDDSPITAIEVAPADSNRVYVGTEKGGIYRSDDGGDNWSGPLQGGVLPGRVITRLRSHPNDADEVFASIGTTGVSHVFLSQDAGANWTDADGGSLPDVPFNGLALSTANPNLLFACCDIGVFMRDAPSGDWHDISGNLPNQIFMDIGYHVGSNSLIAASYGRSLWTLDLAQD